MKGWVVVIAVAIPALLVGLAIALVGWVGFLLLAPLFAAALVLFDYRIGVIILTLLIPFSGSPLMPRAEAMNPYTYITAATICGLIVKRFSSSRRIVWPPGDLLYLFVLPLVLGFLLGLPHLSTGARNLAAIDPTATLTTMDYFRRVIYTPLLIVLFALLLANAAADSKKPWNYIVIFAISAAAVVAYVMTFTLLSGVSWGNHRWIIGEAGMHYNSYGRVFALAFGPLLYVTFSERGQWRAFFGLATIIVFVGLIFNFARGGMLSAAITIFIFVWQRRSIGTAIVIIFFVVCAIAIAPEEWRTRMLQGSDEITTSYGGERFSDLTSGRLQMWMDMAPDVALSPIFGRGTNSGRWNSAVTQGIQSSNHPHNIYLQLLLDIGVAGMAAVLWFFFKMLQRMRILSHDENLDPRLRAFFAGSFASFLSMLIVAATGGDWFPDYSHGLLWFSIGLTIYHWNSRKHIEPIVRDRFSGESSSLAISNESSRFVGVRVNRTL